MGFKINLGCSDGIMPNYQNVDIWKPPNADASFRKVDLNFRWPWEAGDADHIRAHDIIEHLKDPILTMNEAHRVLKAGGTFDIFVPTTDGRGAFQDPTHVTFWNPNSFFYYVDVFAEWKRFHESMGVTARFRLQGCKDVEQSCQYLEACHIEYPGKVWKLRVTLEAIK